MFPHNTKSPKKIRHTTKNEDDERGKWKAPSLEVHSTMSSIETMFSLESYMRWSREEAKIEAPKVAIQQVDQDQRGLFATETIYPGERILFMPSQSLLGSQGLRERGESALSSFANDPTEPRRPREWETLAWAMIEELRQLILDPESPLHNLAVSVGYEWRDDDAVALTLTLTRFIRDHLDPPLQADGEACSFGSTSALDQEAIESDATPIVEAIPLSEDPSSEPTNSHLRTSWLPHVAMLPRSFSCPLYFEAHELTRIEGTNCHGFAVRMLQQIQQDWLMLQHLLRMYQAYEERSVQCKSCLDDRGENISPCWCHKLDLAEIVSLDMYMWALVNVYSRSTDFSIQKTDGEDASSYQRVIGPLFDMMNHDFESPISHAMDTSGNLSVFNGSTESIEEGDEIKLSYGRFGNEKLLTIYGFTVSPNPYDTVSIFAPVQSSDALYSAKVKVLAENCPWARNASAFPHALATSNVHERRHVIPSSLLSVLRVVGVQSEEELHEVQAGDEGTIALVSPQNEFGALSALRSALDTMARQMALNLISDENLHASSSRTKPQHHGSASERLDSENVRNARTLCQSELTILQVALAELTERLEALQDGGVDQQ
jgi:hypothetical protein